MTADLAVRPAPGQIAPSRWELSRWAPLATAIAGVTAILLAADTHPQDLMRFAGYAVLAVALPGTLVYRTLRRTPRTFVEDVTIGVAIGLCLELVVWILLSIVDLRGWASLWPLAVIVPFAMVPGLRKHWRPTGYSRTPLGWAWAMAALVVVFTAYLAMVFLERNPILPDGESTRQYLDLAYQLSLAGEAKHHFPMNIPQTSGEPLHYHWFGYVHMAMTSMVGHIDLPVVTLRLAVPGLCAAAIMMTGVVAWRLSGRPYAGIGAVLLFWLIGEITFTDPIVQPFGTQSMTVVWHGMSMIYSWVLLLALIFAICEVLRGERRALALVVVLAVASSGAKASSLPVTLLALAFTGLVLLIWQRRIPWVIVGLGAIVGGVQVLSAAVLFRFQTYGLELDPFANLRNLPKYAAAVFAISLLIKYVGAIPLVGRRMKPEQIFLIGGALAGPALYLLFSSQNSQYFTRAGFTFGVLIAAWGWSEVFAPRLLWVVVPWAGVLIVAQLEFAAPGKPLESILDWSLILGIVIVIAYFVGRRALVISMILVAGAPALVMDVVNTMRSPNGGPHWNIDLPLSRVEAARWVRDHSTADEVLATNVHCRVPEGACDPVSFWLSAYSEREVFLESWGFIPERFALMKDPVVYWDAARQSLNDSAFIEPTPALLAELRDQHHVRWLVIDREVSIEPDAWRDLAKVAFDNGRIVIYRLT